MLIMDWIKNISNAITTTLDKARTPLVGIPPILLLCEIKNRPGMSAIALASAIISRLAAAGFNTGKNEDGSENMNNQFIRVLCEELVKEIKDNAVVESSIPIGSISITGIGGNAGGPVTIQGYNNMVTKVKGLLR